MKDCDCENCILGWEEWGQEDCDAGCYYYPDLGTNGLMCHAPMFIKKLLLNRKIRQRDRYFEKEFDGYVEFLAEQKRKDNAIADAIKEILLKDGHMICYKGCDGNIYPCEECYVDDCAMDVRQKYEELSSRKEIEE